MAGIEGADVGPLEAKIDELNLDLKNPRNNPAQSSLEALKSLVDEQGPKLLTLARSIVEEGVSPIDALMVMRDKDSGELVVLEGNRRVAVLKILANPRLLDQFETSPAFRRSFTKLAEQFKPEEVEPIRCHEVEDRAAASSWIHLRHTGENSGKGVVGWSGLQATRFRGGTPALQALALVTSFGGLTDEQRAQLEDRFPITTLDRLLSSREVRKRLGFDVKDGKLVSDLPPSELIKPLRQMVLDLADGVVNVSDLKNKAQQIEYVDSFESRNRPDLKKRGEMRPVDEIAGTEFVSKGRGTSPKKKPKKGAPDPSKRSTIVPRKHASLSITDNRIASIFGELCRLKLEDAPNGIAVLLRVFIELSVDSFLERHKIPIKGKDPKTLREYDLPLKRKVEEAVKKLIADGANKKDFVGVVRAISIEQSPLYFDLLHGYVHNRFTTPKTHDLKSSWDDAQRFFEGLWP